MSDASSSTALLYDFEIARGKRDSESNPVAQQAWALRCSELEREIAVRNVKLTDSRPAGDMSLQGALEELSRERNAHQVTTLRLGLSSSRCAALSLELTHERAARERDQRESLDTIATVEARIAELNNRLVKMTNLAAALSVDK